MTLELQKPLKSHYEHYSFNIIIQDQSLYPVDQFQMRTCDICPPKVTKSKWWSRKIRVYEQRIIEVQKGLNGPTIQLCATCWDLRVSLKYYFNILGL